jgi:hypothetical protein
VLKQTTASTWGFIAVWAGFIFVIDGVVLWNMRKASISATWPSTPGIVTKSELQSVGKRSKKLDLEYRFFANGERFQGTRYWYGSSSPRDRIWADIHAELPVSSPVMVYYDPAAPHEAAVLVPGVRPSDFYILFVLAPFTLLAGGLAYSQWTNPSSRYFNPEWHVQPTATGYAATLNGGHFYLITFIAFGGLCILAFLLGIPLMECFHWQPTWWGNVSLVLAILAASPAIGGYRIRNRTLYDNPEILRMPGTSTGTQHVEIPRNRVQAIDLRTENRSGRGGRYNVFIVRVIWAENDEKCETPFAEYRNKDDAEALADWLCERLGPSVEAVLAGN